MLTRSQITQRLNQARSMCCSLDVSFGAQSREVKDIDSKDETHVLFQTMRKFIYIETEVGENNSASISLLTPNGVQPCPSIVYTGNVLRRCTNPAPLLREDSYRRRTSSGSSSSSSNTSQSSLDPKPSSSVRQTFTIIENADPSSPVVSRNAGPPSPGGTPSTTKN